MAYVLRVHSKLCTFKFQFEINAAFVAKAAFFWYESVVITRHLA